MPSSMLFLATVVVLFANVMAVPQKASFKLINQADVLLRAVASTGAVQYLNNGESMVAMTDGPIVTIKLQRWCPGFYGKGNWADVILAEAQQDNSAGAWFRLNHLRTNQRAAMTFRVGVWKTTLNVGGSYPIRTEVERATAVGGRYPLTMYLNGPGKACDGDCADWRRDYCNIAAPA